jgi:hypothetical protein
VFDGTEVQLFAVLTIKVYEPVESPEKVPAVPFPEDVIPLGLLVKTQLLFAGNPVSATLPVLEAHDGCVINPITGAVGISAITTLVIAVTIPQPPAAVIE